ncbi:mitochondrial fission ELM1 family protein [Candidatus Pelagibacter sp. HIMB1517]|uniref:mitochondrial fission ELM1 family protein n=1 Tax=Candidatus Pelagibacter sp. HIMB1517 TaxID=3413341 RepID=UPI003F86D583
MISQVEGLAKSLNTTFDHHTIDLPVLFKFLPPFLTPKIQQSFNFNEIVKDDSSFPDIIISCGRKSVIPNIVLKKYFKKKFNKDLKNIHIQDPKISSKNFDLIITPQHDNKINSENIIRSVGALHYLNEEEVINKNNGENVITFVLGGPNKYYNFKKEDLEVHFEKINNNKNLKKINVIASRRTPKSVFNFLSSKFNRLEFCYDFSLNKKNYTNAYAEASHIVVTCDSTSMISEAAITGKPLYVAKLPNFRNDYRFEKFLQSFKDLNIIKEFNGNLEHWTYEKLYESKRIAKIIIEKFNLDK